MWKTGLCGREVHAGIHPCKQSCPNWTDLYIPHRLRCEGFNDLQIPGRAEGGGPIGSYEFLIDGAPPTLGPTDAHGNYLFERNVITQSEQNKLPDRESYPASVITSTQSGNHTIDVKIVCTDDLREGGCEVTAHWSTMRVDVFEP